MAIYTTFFLANPSELLAGFPEWKEPLPAPVLRQFRNPFTKQLVSTLTRKPEWPDEENQAVSPQFRAATIQGRYEDHLEARLPQFVRATPHWATKGLTDIELEPLLTAIAVDPKLESPLYAPPSSGAVLREFPLDFIPRLLQIDQPELARQWAAEMSSPEHTHSATGMKLQEGWTTEQASLILTPIVSLARTVKSDQRLYLLIEM